MLMYYIITGEKREYAFEGGGVPSGTFDGKYLIFSYNDNKYRMGFNDPPDIRSKSVGTILYKLEIESGKISEVLRDDKHKSVSI